MCPSTPGIPRLNQRAFTRIELLAIIGGLALLLIVLLPALGNDVIRTSRAVCSNNLNQIGQALASWAADHDERYPWHVSTSLGGTAGSFSDRSSFHLAPLSNEVKTPALFVCPSDTAKTRLNSFQGFSDRNVSYILAHPSLSEGRGILSGDRNLSPNLYSSEGCSEFGAAKWLARPSTNAAWSLAVHIRRGHLLFNDGSVESTDESRLRSALSLPGVSNGFHYLAPRDL